MRKSYFRQVLPKSKILALYFYSLYHISKNTVYRQLFITITCKKYE